MIRPVADILRTHGIDASRGLDYLRDEVHLVAVCFACESIIVAPDAASFLAYQRAFADGARQCCTNTPLLTF